MERMEGLMRGLRLSQAEMKGVKLSGEDPRKGKNVEPQAIGKLMLEKQAHPGAIENALGPIWCPMKGIDCKDLGDNVFLFTFKQEGGWKKAVENGPWMFEKELLVMEEYDPAKKLEEYLFSHILIWVRVYRLPLGKMNPATGTLIRDRVGEYVEMDRLEKCMVVGKCLRVKVRKCLAEPLMRGTMVEVDEKGKTIWCPMEYEYLPDFSFICGIISHIDKGCSIRLKRGEEPQFGKWLKWVPPKKVNPFGAQRSWSDSRGRRNYLQGSNESKMGSDGPAWRRTTSDNVSGGKSSDGGEKDVISPLKLTLKGSEAEKRGAQMNGGGKSASKSLNF
ncbi:hypothetical protein ACQ4PT_001842 [Festuca glaucescens]